MSWETNPLHQVTFTYDSTTLELRSPKLGNTLELNHKVSIGRLKSGTITVVRDPIWPKFVTHTYNFELHCEPDIQVILDFLKLTLGQEIQLLDYESRTWTGMIMNPDSQIKTRYGLQFEIIFEGRLVSW